MAAISGLTGSVTFASGYTTLARGWVMSIDAAQQDLTPLSPAGGHMQLLEDGLLQGASGAYGCRLAVDNTAALTSDDYDPNPEEWLFESFCEAREITPLGADWRTYVAGLKSTRIQYVSYLDDTEAMIVADQYGDATLTAATGVYYSVPYVIETIDSGVDTDDAERRCIISANAYEAPSVEGGLPIAGVSGAATFVAVTGRQYGCTILVTSVRTRVNRRTSTGSIDISFVANGAVTPA